MKTATSTSLILAATIALAALITPKAAAGSDELAITERGHSLKVGDVVFYDADAGKHVAVPISYLMGEVEDNGNELLLVTSVAPDGFSASPVESDEDEDEIDAGPRVAESKAAAPAVTAPQTAADGDTVVLVIKHADAEALRTALAAVLGKDATVTVTRSAERQEVLAMTN